MCEIRAIMNEVRAGIRRPHPFATNVVFRTDGSRIVAEIAHRNGVVEIYDLRIRSFEIGVVVYTTLKDGVIYDSKGDAKGCSRDASWHPTL